MGVFADLSGSFDYEIVDEFMDHYEIMNAALQPAILALDKPEEYAGRINELFRIFHNLKSASAYLKLEAINRLSAFVEDVLERARGREGPATAPFIDWLLKVADQFDSWYNDLSHDHARFTALDFSIFDLPVE